MQAGDQMLKPSTRERTTAEQEALALVKTARDAADTLSKAIADALPALAKVEAERPGDGPHPINMAVQAREFAVGVGRTLNTMLDYGLDVGVDLPRAGHYAARQREAMIAGIGEARGAALIG